MGKSKRQRTNNTAKKGKGEQDSRKETKQAQQNSTTTFQVLLCLSEQLLHQECYLQSFICLEAVCNLPEIVPAKRAIACVKLANLVLDHFDNVDFAKNRLLQAEREVRNSRGHLVLKLQIFSLISQCHLIGDDLEPAVDICKSGLQLCSNDDLREDDQKLMDRWRVYFLFQQLKCQTAMIDRCNLPHTEAQEEHIISSATETLQSLDSLRSKMSYEEKTVLAMSHAVVDMKNGNTDSADKWLTDTATDLGNAFKKNNSSINVSLESLRAQYYLLYALNAQLSGRAGQLASGSSFPAFEEFFKSMDKLGKMKESMKNLNDSGVCRTQAPLGDSCARILGDLTQASLLRTSGRSADAAIQFANVEESIEAASHSNFSDVLSEAESSQYRLFVQKPLCQLKCLALEHRVLSALVACDFRNAARLCSELGNLIRNHPKSLKYHIGSFCMLLGQYFHSTQEYDAAITIYNVLQQHGPKQLRHMAALNAALTEIHDDGRSDIVAASLRMKESGLDSSVLGSLPIHERSIAQMINGLILYKEGDSTGSRLLLTKALKQAHGMVGSGQFVGQILNALAPVQKQRNDHAGALQMFESATTLLKSVKDLMSLVTTLIGMQKLYQEMNQPEKASACQEYLEKKANDLDARLKLVYDSEEHREAIQLGTLMRQMLLDDVPA